MIDWTVISDENSARKFGDQLLEFGLKPGAGRALGICAHRSFLSYVACVVEVEMDGKGGFKLSVFGFAPDDDGVHLKCRPDTEAETFATGSLHDTWEHLPEIHTEVLVVAGRVEPMQPSMIAAGVAERLPNARYVQLDQLDHFGPMVRPLLVADLIAEELSRT